MFRQMLFASAALGAAIAAPGVASAADAYERNLLQPPLEMLIDADGGASAPADASASTPAAAETPSAPEAHRYESNVSAVGSLDPAAFADVGELEIDMKRVAGALGMEVDRRESALMGRVALRVVSDPTYGAPSIVTDPYDPAVRRIERATTAPVGLQDITADGGAVTPRRGVRLDYSAPVASRIGGLDVAVEPRANLVVGDDVSGVGGGAIVRFGRDLTKPRRERSRWYAFVGADAQALTWAFNGNGRGEALRLEDKQLVGDYQAGVAVRMGRGDLAFGVVHREVKWKDYSRTEQFVGVSYAIRR